MAYAIIMKTEASRELGKIQTRDQGRLAVRIIALASEPRPNDAKAYKGVKGGYRVRVGDYRIAYQVDDAKLAVYVIRIGGRGNVYKDRS